MAILWSQSPTSILSEVARHSNAEASAVDEGSNSLPITTTLVVPGERRRCDICRKDKKKCVFSDCNESCDRCLQNNYNCTVTEHPPPAKRRKLSKYKCKHCRDLKQKCIPEDRVWPAKCARCIQAGLPCSKPEAFSQSTPAPNTATGINERWGDHYTDQEDTFIQLPNTTMFSSYAKQHKPTCLPNEGNDKDAMTLQRSETPPRPFAAIPFSRDADFVEREAILDQVHRRCAVPGSWAALVGLGGVGKSQLAIEYAYRTHERLAETWVLWVHANSAARFEQSYRDIADRVKIFGRKDPKADIFKLVHDWLCNSRDRWLLVLDNVDDARFLVDVPIAQRNGAANSGCAPQPLRSYIPHSERGSVLITTRNQDAALQLVGRRECITVEPMNHGQASALFQKKLEEDEDPLNIDELAAALEYMPLAIVQAAAYIVRRAPRCSVKQYLADFRRSDRKRTALLNSEAGQLRRDYEAKNSIIMTWQISFDHIRETQPSAGDLLSLMSFFDRQGIPETLLRAWAQAREESTPEEQHKRGSMRQTWEDEDTASQSSAGDDRFEDDVQTLRDYSFISANTDGASFEMHRLVQFAMRKWLQAHDELEQWKCRFVSNLCAAFPIGNFENWAVCQGLFAHAKSAAEQRPEKEGSLIEWALLLYKAAWYALEVGNWTEAEAMSLQSTKTRRKILGVDHPDTLTSMDNLASTYRNQGRWEEAETLFVQVTETRKTKLGTDHPDTLTSMNNLAFTFESRGEVEKATGLMEKCVEKRKQVLGPNHPDTINSKETLDRWRIKALELGSNNGFSLVS